MWDVLKPTHIEEAQRQLKARRADLLQRQAEELARLQADETDLEALDRLAASFSRKFKTAAAPPIPAIAVERKSDRAAVPQPPVSARPQPRPAPSEKRNLSGTNFEVFSRAVSKSGF
jgi:hypothetical protein